MRKVEVGVGVFVNIEKGIGGMGLGEMGGERREEIKGGMGELRGVEGGFDLKIKK